jgi:hypothetical protein
MFFIINCQNFCYNKPSKKYFFFVQQDLSFFSLSPIVDVKVTVMVKRSLSLSDCVFCLCYLTVNSNGFTSFKRN